MAFSPRSYENWARFLGTAVEERKDQLATIFDAASVRELWLQGELYLAAKRASLPFLHMNLKIGGYPGFADLSYWTGDDANADLLMVGELKLIGTRGYFKKNFDGWSALYRGYLDELGANGKVLVTPESLRERPPCGGLLGDYNRLASFDRQVLKLLVLVLDTRGEKDELGQLLCAVDFLHPGRTLFEEQSLGILCRIWEVG